MKEEPRHAGGRAWCADIFGFKSFVKEGERDGGVISVFLCLTTFRPHFFSHVCCCFDLGHYCLLTVKEKSIDFYSLHIGKRRLGGSGGTVTFASIFYRLT